MSEERFGNGITLASGFDLGAKAPLDSRYTVAKFEDLQAHVDGNRAYEGMLVYVEEDKKVYQYTLIVIDEETGDTELQWKVFYATPEDLEDISNRIGTPRVLDDDETEEIETKEPTGLYKTIEEFNSNLIAEINAVDAKIGFAEGYDGDTVSERLDDIEASLGLSGGGSSGNLSSKINDNAANIQTIGSSLEDYVAWKETFEEIALTTETYEANKYYTKDDSDNYTLCTDESYDESKAPFYKSLGESYQLKKKVKVDIEALRAAINDIDLSGELDKLDFNDPTVSGSNTSFIATISQENGLINATKASLPEATTEVKGIVKLNNTLTSDATNEALTAAQGKALDAKITAIGNTAVKGIKINDTELEKDSNNIVTIPLARSAYTEESIVEGGAGEILDYPAKVGVIIPGEGVNVDEDGILNVKIDPNGEKYLTIDNISKGIKLSGIDEAINAVKNNAISVINSGDNAGTIKYTKDNTSWTEVAVTGLKSAAYTESTAYDGAGAAASAEANSKEYTDGQITSTTTAINNKIGTLPTGKTSVIEYVDEINNKIGTLPTGKTSVIEYVGAIPAGEDGNPKAESVVAYIGEVLKEVNDSSETAASVNQKLETEIARAKAAEQGLQSSINAMDSSIQGLQSSINAMDFESSSEAGKYITSLKQVDGKITEVTKESLPEASTIKKGIVQLHSGLNSDSEIMAATPKAVKDLDEKITSLNNSAIKSIKLESNNSVDDYLQLESTNGEIAIPLAKVGYTETVDEIDVIHLPQPGVVKLINTINSVDEEHAVTPKAVAAVAEEAFIEMEGVKDRIDVLEGKEDTYATKDYVGTIPNSYTETNVISYIDKKAEEVLAAANGGSSESAASVALALQNYKNTNDPKVNSNTAAIESLTNSFNELTDNFNINFDNNSLIITDEADNIIGKFDQNGLTTTNLKLNSKDSDGNLINSQILINYNSVENVDLINEVDKKVETITVQSGLDSTLANFISRGKSIILPVVHSEQLTEDGTETIFESLGLVAPGGDLEYSLTGQATLIPEIKNSINSIKTYVKQASLTSTNTADAKNISLSFLDGADNQTSITLPNATTNLPGLVTAVSGVVEVEEATGFMSIPLLADFVADNSITSVKSYIDTANDELKTYVDNQFSALEHIEATDDGNGNIVLTTSQLVSAATLTF